MKINNIPGVPNFRHPAYQLNDGKWRPQWQLDRQTFLQRFPRGQSPAPSEVIRPPMTVAQVLCLT